MPTENGKNEEPCGAGFQPAPQLKEEPPEPEEIAASSEPNLTQGSCVLKKPEIAQIVQNAILYFEQQRYLLLAWCVMPNHVHVALQTSLGYSLKSVLHTWKSYTSNQINAALSRIGELWERESFNHLIRTEDHVARFVCYTEDNPVAAHLCPTPRDWPFSSAGTGFQPEPVPFIAPRELPFVEPRSRGELPHLQKDDGTYFVTWKLLDAIPPRSH